MDRLSFIKENHLNQTEIKCGQTLCECDDVNNSNWIRSMKKTNRFHLVGMALSAFLCAVVFAKFKNDAAKINIDEWLSQKNQTAIGCGSSGQSNLDISWPEDKNNSKGCAHQFANLAGMVSDKKNKIHSC